MTLTESSRKGTALAQFRQIYRWQLKRSRLISILCLGLTFLCFTVVHLCESARNYHDYFNMPLGLSRRAFSSNGETMGGQSGATENPLLRRAPPAAKVWRFFAPSLS